MVLCFSDTLQHDEYKGIFGKNMLLVSNNVNNFNVNIEESLLHPCCIISSIPLLSPCTQTYIRYKVLNHIYPNSNWDKYSLFQDYSSVQFDFLKNFTNYPKISMFMESFFCPGMSALSSRMLLMEKYRFKPQLFDIRLIKINNLFDNNYYPILHENISCVISTCCIGGLSSQTINELNYQKNNNNSTNNSNYQSLEDTFAFSNNNETNETNETNEENEIFENNESTPLITQKVPGMTLGDKLLNSLSTYPTINNGDSIII